MSTKIFFAASSLLVAAACTANDNRDLAGSDQTAQTAQTADSASTSAMSTGMADTTSGATGVEGGGMPMASTETDVGSGSHTGGNRVDDGARSRMPMRAKTSSTVGAGARKPDVKADQKAGQNADQMLQDQLKVGQNYQVIDFKKGSDQLTEGSKSKLKSLLDSAKTRGEISDVHVAVWSDKAFPVGRNASDLPERDRDLADKRIDTISAYLKDDLAVSDVDTYSMAEKSNWFARAFGTSEAELKSLFSQEGAPANVDPQELRIVKQKGGPMKGVILIESKDSASGTTSGATSGTDGSWPVRSTESTRDLKDYESDGTESGTSEPSEAQKVPGGPVRDWTEDIGGG